MYMWKGFNILDTEFWFASLLEYGSKIPSWHKGVKVIFLMPSELVIDEYCGIKCNIVHHVFFTKEKYFIT